MITLQTYLLRITKKSRKDKIPNNFRYNSVNISTSKNWFY